MDRSWFNCRFLLALLTIVVSFKVKMKVNSAKYTANANSYDKCPACDKPEFAFIGRSNVGKSSLINALTNRKSLAKVSLTPGKTRLINFFTVNDAFHLVDLPGYGFAKVSMDINEEFNHFSAEYLSQRESLKCIFVLIDSRHKPQEIDLEFMEWIVQFPKKVVIVFTKSDLPEKGKVAENAALFKTALAERGIEMPEYLSCSSKKGAGKMPVFNHIQRYLPKVSKDELKRKKSTENWLKKVRL